jgi:hypothetical protein
MQNFWIGRNRLGSNTPGVDTTVTTLLLVYNEYKETSEYQDAKKVFQDYNYWRPGKYDVSVIVHVRLPGSNKIRHHDKLFGLEIADEDPRKLLANFETMSDKALLNVAGSTNFIYPRVFDAPVASLDRN